MENTVELPAEILCEIFHLAQVHVAAEFVDLNLVDDNARLAIAVSQVCQHWRNAALGFAGLWVYIPYQHQHHRRIPQIKEYILRSNGQPLTLFLSFSDEIAPKWTRSTCVSLGKASGSECLPMIDILEEYLDQAEYICIEEPRPRASLVVLYARKHPRLKSLSFRRPSTSSERDCDVFLPAAFYEPFTCLKYLHLDRVSFHPDSVVLASNLNNVSLHVSGLLMYTALAPSSRTLTSLTLGPKVHTRDVPSPSHTVFTALKTLTLVNNTSFLQWLNTPNLKTLELCSYTFRSFVCALSDLRPRQYARTPKLEVLSIHLIENDEKNWVTDNDEWLSALFRMLPTVTTVHWDVHPTRIHVLEAWASALGGVADEEHGVNWAELREVTVKTEEARKALLGALPDTRQDVAGMIKRK
ncbi:hypothetical protein CYLTODRAFT_489981 [Cylindrobasidium torrendii FP15055 ss-10]|uniref:Uncharacterized protein n=1 Tax=Cylindrobasidium torrendii FP15055 ss-10 TaxID=1314674 RepID=A0A0D7BD43_9AGAR|nr:hypothetical protein CYLTODRAFT_489981 [Cylindrobasidium torrendii FP15055 ss-10]